MDKSHKSFKSRQSNDVLYSRSLLSRTICIPMINVGKNISDTLDKYIAHHFEGKCAVEGFIKPRTSKLITFSSGKISGTSIIFNVVFECSICCPVEGMLLQCVAINITKAGIRAEIANEDPSPVVIFITRDHHYMKSGFSTIQEGNTVTIRVIGQRFELNDKYISIIASLVEEKKYTQPGNKNMIWGKPKLLLVE